MFAQASETQAYAYVSAVQPPAWLEENGHRTALTASSAIMPGRIYTTGKQGRLQIVMADGSVVKLGENSRFELPRLQLQQSGSDDVLKGAFKVSHGIFRYSAQGSSFVRKRVLDIYLGSALTIGIGNPDFFGQSDAAQDSLCLIRGKINIRNLQLPILLMDRANSAYIAPRGQTPSSVMMASTEQIRSWTLQTELDDSRPSLQSNGPYSVLVAVYLDEPHANAIVADINQKGYPAVLRSEKRGDTPVYKVLVEGLSNERSALAYAEALKKPLYLKNPRVLAPGQQE